MDELLTRLARLDHVSGELACSSTRSGTHVAACSVVTGLAADCARWRFPAIRRPARRRLTAVSRRTGMEVCLNSLSSGQST